MRCAGCKGWGFVIIRPPAPRLAYFTECDVCDGYRKFLYQAPEPFDPENWDDVVVNPGKYMKGSLI